MRMKDLNRFFKGFTEGTRSFTETIAVIINTFLLSLAYFIGIGITSIIAKFSGKHFLEKKFRQNTYWEGSNIKKKKIEEYYRQF